MKPFLSESWKRTDRDVSEGERKRGLRERERERDGDSEEREGEREKRRDKIEAGHRHLCENNTF